MNQFLESLYVTRVTGLDCSDAQRAQRLDHCDQVTEDVNEIHAEDEEIASDSVISTNTFESA